MDLGTGTLDLTETPRSGEPDTLMGTLTFNPSGLTLQVRGRRVPAVFGETEGIMLEGSGAIPRMSGSPITLKYDLVGTLSPKWQQDQAGLTITGAIRAASFDPKAPTGTVGAFVLVPLQPLSLAGRICWVTT